MVKRTLVSLRYRSRQVVRKSTRTLLYFGTGSICRIGRHAFPNGHRLVGIEGFSSAAVEDLRSGNQRVALLRAGEREGVLILFAGCEAGLDEIRAGRSRRAASRRPQLRHAGCIA